MSKSHDYTIGTITSWGQWTAMRTALGTLFGGILTASAISAGEDGWIVSVRATRRLTGEEQLILKGWMIGWLAQAA